MPELLDHLLLPIVPDEYQRRSRSGGGYKEIPRDKPSFFQTELQSFNNIKRAYSAQKTRYRDYFDPNLIFKIKLNQNVNEDGFRDELRRMGIDVIIPSPNKTGYWVVFTEDAEFARFREKLEQYADNENRYQFFNAIDGISDIPPEEKIGEKLRSTPLIGDESILIDVSIWRMDDEKLDVFLNGLGRLIINRNGSIYDIFRTENFCLLKIEANNELIEELLNLREIEQIDRPPKSKIEAQLNTDIQDVEVIGAPPEDSTGILIVDSGILPSHPLLANSIGDAISIATRDGKRVRTDSPYDDVGHGTEVAGIAQYGDIAKCIEELSFIPKLWIFSSKIMYKDEDGNATYDENELLEHQLDKAVRRIADSYPNCRVVNISFGDASKRMSIGKRQFNIASLIDDLSNELGLIFVISTGNYEDRNGNENYPNYLIDESNDNVKIIDTASSALSITVGAVCRHGTGSTHNQQNSFVYYPSPITRMGPGYNGMIKPELVENGGGGFDNACDVITVNSKWLEEHRLFTLKFGTSFSAPKIAHAIGTIANEHKDWSNNLIKAVLLSSANIPTENERPGTLSEISISDSDKKAINILKIYGYGIPNIEKALHSEKNRVSLIAENKVKLNHVHLYQFHLPSNFLTENGKKTISVTLVYDPPTSKKRVDYLGVNFETHLFKNKTLEEVIQAYSKTRVEGNNEEIVPPNIARSEIKLHPGVKLRKKGAHQKGIIEYTNRPSIDTNIPLTLVVICQDKWVKNDNYLQDYAIIVNVEHVANIDLYNQIRLRNRGRTEILIGG